jgi:hypothetical protein
MVDVHAGSKPGTTDLGDPERARVAAPAWVPRILWVVLGLVTVSLLVLATTLLIRSRFFSSSTLSDEQLKALWVFLGVALGSATTLVGALLTEQNNRRTLAIAREAGQREQLAKERQQSLAEETEERLVIDTVAKVLELITIEGGYAPRARVAGAIATMVQLHGGTIAVRILGELWKDDAVDSDTAVWLIDHIFQEYANAPPGPSEQEVGDAAALLHLNVHKLLPKADDADQTWYFWPRTFDGKWPASFPTKPKILLCAIAIQLLLSRETSYWSDTGCRYPVDMLCSALDDIEIAHIAAGELCALIDSGVFDGNTFPLQQGVDSRARELGNGIEFNPWFLRLLKQLGPWARGEDRAVVVESGAAAAVADTTMGIFDEGLGENTQVTPDTGHDERAEQPGQETDPAGEPDAGRRVRRARRGRSNQ